MRWVSLWLTRWTVRARSQTRRCRRIPGRATLAPQPRTTHESARPPARRKRGPTPSRANIIKTTTYEFTWGESIQGNTNLYLYADFLRYVTFSGDWTLTNLPSSNDFIRDSFYCEKGAKAGESINKVYCRPTIDYMPKLKRNYVDVDGNIVQTDYLFDATGKNIQNAVDLKNLKLESITCTTSMW